MLPSLSDKIIHRGTRSTEPVDSLVDNLFNGVKKSMAVTKSSDWLKIDQYLILYIKQ